MKTAKILLIILAIAAFSTAALAQDKKLELAMEYLVLTNTKETMDSTIEVYVAQISVQNSQLKKEDIRTSFNSVIGWEVIRDQLAQVVANAFTEEELSGINAFYKTKYGSTLARQSPKISSGLSEILSENMKKRMAAEKDPK